MSGHGHVDPSNKKVALVIAVLALFLAISETLSKAYQTEVITKQVEASNLWAFFQAKSIRKTTTDVALQSAQMSPQAEDPKVAEQMKKWAAASKRYDTEPETGEGRKELAERAKKGYWAGVKQDDVSKKVAPKTINIVELNPFHPRPFVFSDVTHYLYESLKVRGMPVRQTTQPVDDPRQINIIIAAPQADKTGPLAE